MSFNDGTFPAKAHKSGNSIVVTIPPLIREMVGIKDGTKIVVTVRKLDNKEVNQE